MEKLIISSLLFLTVSAEPSKAELMKQVSDLQKKLASQSGASGSGGLKVNDLSGKKADSGTVSGQKISPEQMKEIQNQLKNYKKQREEHQKYLDELMNE